MPQAVNVVEASQEGRAVSDAEVAVDGSNVVATFPGRDLGIDALRDMFGPGETKTLYVRPVIHAITAGTQTPPPATGAPPQAPGAGSDPAKLIADERKCGRAPISPSSSWPCSCRPRDAMRTIARRPRRPEPAADHLLDRQKAGVPAGQVDHRGEQVKNATASRESQDGQSSSTWSSMTPPRAPGRISPPRT